MPVAAGWLGGLGALPFVMLAAATRLPAAQLHGLAVRGLAVQGLAAYGATILAFLGGVHWGLAIAAHAKDPSLKPNGWLILSVIPSLAGWSALLLPSGVDLSILAACFSVMLWIDLRATRIGRTPAWYPTLRIPLTLAAVAGLIIGAVP